MDKIVIITPEQIELEYDLAGLGSRFVAFIIDSIVQWSIIILLFVAMIISVPNLFETGITSLISNVVAAICIVLIFVMLFGYFIFFETLWTGQTPGKKAAQIQVIKDNGEPISFSDSFLRNIFRIIDFLPWYYLLGIILILVNKQNKRLGDYVAKTIVVRLKSNLAPVVLPQLNVYSDVLMDVSQITEAEFGLVRDFLLRRDQLRPGARKILAEKISSLLMNKTQVDKNTMETEEFLEILAVRYKERVKTI